MRSRGDSVIAYRRSSAHATAQFWSSILGAKTIGGNADRPAPGGDEPSADDSPPIIAQELKNIRCELTELKLTLARMKSNKRQPLSVNERLTAIEHAVARANDASAQVEEARSRQRDAEDLLGQVRQLLAATAQKLAQAETRLHQQDSEAEWLRANSGRADELTNEINALRYRCEQAESAIVRLRNSVSWHVTKPLRWIGNRYGKFNRGRR